MDKNTVIGLVLIGLVIFGFSWLNRPDPQEIEAQRKAAIEAARQDSIAKAEAELLAARTQEATPDSIKQAAGYNQYGLLAVATAGAEEQVELANGKIALKLSTKGEPSGKFCFGTIKRTMASLSIFSERESRISTCHCEPWTTGWSIHAICTFLPSAERIPPL